MTPPTNLTSSDSLAAAARALCQGALAQLHARTDTPTPEDEHAWTRYDDVVGEIAYAAVSWQHANATVNWGDQALSMLDVVVKLQQHVWGIEAERCTSVLDMSIIPDTGGSILFAYKRALGLTPEGWLGFVLGYGARSGVLASRFLAVKQGYRLHGIARDLKFLQAYLALRSGHHAIEWTYDPMRSANAHLNLNRLGAAVHRYVESKYGAFRSALYGPVPSHRFFVRWNLTLPETITMLSNTQPSSPRENASSLPDIPSLNHADFQHVLDGQPPMMRFAIPYDIDTFARQDRPAALRLRQNFHQICLHTLDAKRPVVQPSNDPAHVGVESRSGTYIIAGYVVAPMADGQPGGHYIFARKQER